MLKSILKLGAFLIFWSLLGIYLMPRLPKKTCPTITNMVKIQIGIRYSINKSGVVLGVLVVEDLVAVVLMVFFRL